jgi:hypothetical protein
MLVKSATRTPGQLMMGFATNENTVQCLKIDAEDLMGIANAIGAKAYVYLAIQHDLMSGTIHRGNVEFDEEFIAQFAVRWQLELTQKQIRNILIQLGDKGFLEGSTIQLAFQF